MATLTVEQKVKKMEVIIARYARHDDACHINRGGHSDRCSCGLDELLQTLRPGGGCLPGCRAHANHDTAFP